MRSERDQFISLALRQAKRREAPVNIVKGIVVFSMFMGLCGVLQNCGASDNVKPITKTELKKNYDAIYAGDAAAHRKRF